MTTSVWVTEAVQLSIQLSAMDPTNVLFVITDLDPSCDVVLGMNWLYQHNLLAPDAVELLQDILQLQYRAIARLIVITIVFDYFALARLLVMTIQITIQITIQCKSVTVTLLQGPCPHQSSKHFLYKQRQIKNAKNKNKNSKLSSPVPGPSGTGHRLGIAALVSCYDCGKIFVQLAKYDKLYIKK